ncbi:MAG: hypothetical protein F6K03_10595 [Kamptonema sp. SIO4C4]|nr:hypothetical protein [Kamptonema sp. SIO4C4]
MSVSSQLKQPPKYVTDLIAFYSPPRKDFSNRFYEMKEQKVLQDQVALRYYYFAGPHEDLSHPHHNNKRGLADLAIFYETINPEADLDEIALRYYQQFVGASWDEFGESVWMGSWELLYVRPDGRKGDIVSEFTALEDLDNLSNMLELTPDYEEDYEKSKQYLAAAYDDPEVSQLRIYQIGDAGGGDVMEGRLILGCRRNGEMTILALIDD